MKYYIVIYQDWSFTVCVKPNIDFPFPSPQIIAVFETDSYTTIEKLTAWKSAGFPVTSDFIRVK